MLADRSNPVAQPDGAAEQFVRGFACCPEASQAAAPEPALDGHVGVAGARSEFRLTTVVPGVAVSIEVGGISRPW